MNYYNYVSNRLQPLLNGVLRDFASQASLMYKEAEEHTRNKYNTRIAISAQSYDRHWIANERLYDLALNYDDLEVEIAGNGKNSYYTLIKHNNVILTISQVHTSKCMVRNSKFRNDFASQYGVTQDMFNPKPTRVISKNDPIYAVILHGPISNKDSNIGFVHIALPDTNFKEYPFNECLFKLCDLKHPFKIEETPIETITQNENLKLRKSIS